MFYHFGKQVATEGIILVLVSVKHTLLQLWRQYRAIKIEVLFLLRYFSLFDRETT